MNEQMAWQLVVRSSFRLIFFARVFRNPTRFNVMHPGHGLSTIPTACWHAVLTFLSYTCLVRLHLVDRACFTITRSSVLRLRNRQLASKLARTFQTSNYSEFRDLLQWPLRRLPTVFGGGKHVFRRLALPQLLLQMLTQTVQHPTVWATPVAGYLDERYMFELACCGVLLNHRQRKQLNPWGKFVYTHSYLPLKRAVDAVIRRAARKHNQTMCYPDIVQIRRYRENWRLSPDFSPFHYGSKDLRRQ